MPTVPVILPAGYILVYGIGDESGSGGSVPDNTNIRFGTVYQIWDGGRTFVYGGDKVMFKDKDAYCRLAINNWPYTMIKARLVTKEIITL